VLASPYLKAGYLAPILMTHTLAKLNAKEWLSGCISGVTKFKKKIDKREYVNLNDWQNIFATGKVILLELGEEYEYSIIQCEALLIDILRRDDGIIDRSSALIKVVMCLNSLFTLMDQICSLFIEEAEATEE
jgi:hypothetical protein